MATGTIKKRGMVLLWKNESDMSAFAAQLVSVDLSDYDFVMIMCRTANTTANHGIFSSIYPIGQDCALLAGWYDGNRMSMRRFNTSSSGVTFEGGYYNSASNNAVCIPYEIYGIKA